MTEFVSQVSTVSGFPGDAFGAPGTAGGFLLPGFPGMVECPSLPGRVTVISNLHIPFHSPVRVDSVLSRIESAPPDLLVILGDIWDCYPISRWDKSASRHKRIKDEIEIGRPIIERIDRIGVPTVFLMGNHDERFDILLRKMPELDGSISFREVFKVPGRWEVLPSRSLFKVGGLVYLHGDLPGFRGGAGGERRMLQELKESCIFGHTHSTGSHFLRGSGNRLLQGYAVGHLASPEVSREYRPTNNWVSSFAEIVNHGPESFSVALRLVSECGRIY